MPSHVATHGFGASEVRVLPVNRDLARYLVPVGRVLLVAIFLLQGPVHFSQQAIAYAASEGVPLPSLLVPLSGIIALLGALSVALGYQTRWGALLLVLFLVPVTLMMHRFWAAHDPMAAMIQQAMFLKNLAILGGVLVVSYYGGGPFSVDSWRRLHARPRVNGG